MNSSCIATAKKYYINLSETKLDKVWNKMWYFLDEPPFNWSPRPNVPKQYEKLTCKNLQPEILQGYERPHYYVNNSTCKRGHKGYRFYFKFRNPQQPNFELTTIIATSTLASTHIHT